MRLHLPRIRARRCLAIHVPGAFLGVYCTRAWGHSGRHAATEGPSRVVVAVWPSSTPRPRLGV